MTQAEVHQTSETCANCGAPLSGEFCASCGQSREDLRRPIWGLAADTLDGLFSWDGRMLTTLRQLYTRPGKVARDYADGKRASFTPPVRLYLVVSLVFFAAMTVSGIRIIAVDTAMTANGPGVSVTLFQPPGTNEPLRLSEIERTDFLDNARNLGIPDSMAGVILYAAEHPAEIESKASAAANQAMVLMVLVFIVMNMALHPRVRVIEHVIHALYYHAAFLLAACVVLLVTIPLRLPLPVSLALVGSASLVSLAAYYLFDRGFYGSIWWGALLRALAISIGYTISVIALIVLLVVVVTL